MSIDQFMKKYRSLPQHLQRAADLYIEILSGSPTEVVPAKDTLAGHVRWAKSPDASALFGLTSRKPLNIKTIREKAWQR
jgi:hypothetical protein